MLIASNGGALGWASARHGVHPSDAYMGLCTSLIILTDCAALRALVEKMKKPAQHRGATLTAKVRFSSILYKLSSILWTRNNVGWQPLKDALRLFDSEINTWQRPPNANGGSQRARRKNAQADMEPFGKSISNTSSAGPRRQSTPPRVAAVYPSIHLPGLSLVDLKRRWERRASHRGKAMHPVASSTVGQDFQMPSHSCMPLRRICPVLPSSSLRLTYNCTFICAPHISFLFFCHLLDRGEVQCFTRSHRQRQHAHERYGITLDNKQRKAKQQRERDSESERNSRVLCCCVCALDA